MAKVKFSRTEENDVSSIQIVDGQLIYTKTGKCYLDYGTERIEIVSGGDTVPIGTISSFADVDENSPLISDWILCDGRAISRTTYSELFNIIGTKYGQGDGINTFNVPNLKGKSLVGLDVDDADFNEVGKTGGSKTHTQTWSEMPQHTHHLNYGAVSQIQGAELKGLGGGGYWSDGVNLNTAMSNSGSGAPMDIMNPYTVVKFYIKAFRSASSTAQVKNAKTISSEDTYSCNYINGLSNINTDGEAARSGRTIDGKDEYIKIYHFTGINSANVYTKELGFILDNMLITDLSIRSYSTARDWSLSTPAYQTADNKPDNAVSVYLRANSNNIELTTYNSNITDAYVTICFIER